MMLATMDEVDLPHGGNGAVAIAVGLIWIAMTVSANVILARLWRSPQRSSSFARRLAVLKGVGIHARSLGASVLAGDFTLMLIPVLIFMFLGAGERFGPDWQHFFTLFGAVGFIGMTASLFFIYSTALWRWPRWLIPPYLRDEPVAPRTR